MIIHTTDIIKSMGIKFLKKGEDISKIVKGEEKIKLILFKKTKTSKEIYKELGLTSRAIRKCLLKLEKRGEVKRIKGKEINKKVRYSDSWSLNAKNTGKKVPSSKILGYYRTEHYNKGYRQHYMLLPNKINLNENFISAIGFFDAEGSKTNPKSTEIVNSEPLLIKLFINFLDYFKIKKENLSYKIIFNNKLPYLLKRSKKEITNNAIKFWNNQVKIPLNKKIKINYVGKPKGKSRANIIKYGSLNINYNSVLFRNFLFKLIEKVKENISDEKRAIAYLRGYFCGEAYVGKSDREIQVGSNEVEQLKFSKKLLEKVGVKSSICKGSSTSPPRLIITSLKDFIILENIDLFKFHFDKKKNLIEKILNYKSVENSLRRRLNKKLRRLTN